MACELICEYLRIVANLFMLIKQRKIKGRGLKFSIRDGRKEIARAYLYILKNDLHQQPFGFLEDVFVEEKYRGQGLGTKLVKKALAVARRKNCYKLIATSRHSRKEVHKWYERLGFKNRGLEFRMDLQ